MSFTLFTEVPEKHKEPEDNGFCLDRLSNFPNEKVNRFNSKMFKDREMSKLKCIAENYFTLNTVYCNFKIYPLIDYCVPGYFWRARGYIKREFRRFTY